MPNNKNPKNCFVTGNIDTAQLQTDSVTLSTNSCVLYRASFAEKYIRKAECSIICRDSFASVQTETKRKQRISAVT